MACIVFQDEERAILIPKGISILQACLENKIPIYSECGGRGTCTTCKVKILSGYENLMTRGEKELEIARSRNWDKTIRLACQTRVLGDIVVEKVIKNEEECFYTHLENYYSNPILAKDLSFLVVKFFNFNEMIQDNSNQSKEKLEKVLTNLKDIAILNGGYVAQFQPMFILFVFGMYESNSSHIQNAVRASLLIQQKLEILQKTFQQDESLQNLNYGILVHSGCLKIISIKKFNSIMLEGKEFHEINSFSKVFKHFPKAILFSNSIYNSIDTQNYNFKKVNLINKNQQTKTVYILKENFSYDTLYYIFLSHLIIREHKTDFMNAIFKEIEYENSNLAEKINSDPHRLKLFLFSLYNQMIFGFTRFATISDMIYEIGKKLKFSSFHESDLLKMKEIFYKTLKNFLSEKWNENFETAWREVLNQVSQILLKGFHEDKKIT